MGRKTICQPPREARVLTQKGHRFVSPPLAARAELPTARAILSPKSWQRERVQRAARICRCIEQGRASGKRLHEMLVWFAWRWKGRHFKSDPARRIQFGYGTLRRLYYAWKASGGNVEALAVHYRAPRKLSRGLTLEFAKACLNPEVLSLAQAHGRLRRPAATFFAYRLNLPAKLRQRIIRLFEARRLVAWRARKARAEVNGFARRGAR